MNAATTSPREELSCEKPSYDVVSRIADREGVSPMELSPPLHSVIDPDALDSLFSSPATDASGTPTHVRFDYLGYEVRVRDDGEVVVSRS